MSASARWRFAVEIFPPDWRFPAGASWIAGWILDGEGRAPADLRAWIDRRPVLGLHGLPRPEVEQRERGRAGTPYAGFSFLLTPHRGATQLRLEARDANGTWTEFFRTAITVDATATPLTPPAPLATDLSRTLLAVLKLAAEQPQATLLTLAHEALARRLAEPLESLPNPPFHGALEEPKATGRLRYGRLSISGWLAHRTARITRLTALVDPAQEFTLLHGLPREGVGEIFADLPGRETSQFLGHAELPAHVATPALIRVFAELDNGEKHLVFARRFEPRIIAGAETTLPTRSRRTFARAVWSLRSAATALGIPSGSARDQLAALRDAWSAYAAEAPPPAAARPANPRPLPAAGATTARVLVVTHNLNFEGAPWFIFELARHLAAQPGLSVEIVSPSEGPLRRAFEEAGLTVRVLDVSAALAATSSADFHAELARVSAALDWTKTDLVIANTMVSFWAVHLARAAKKPALLYVHESTPVRRFFEPLAAPALFPEIEAAFRSATRVVYTSASTHRVHAHLDTGNAALLPSWIDLDRIDAFATAHADRAALRRRHGLDPQATLLVNIGSLCERKGQHVFLRAAALLRDELRATYADRRVQFVMVGARPGPYLEALKQEARAGALDDVLFLGETGDIFDFYRLADIFVCTSFEESFPRVLLESAAFGLPIVSTNVNGIAEMLRPDEAWLMPPGDRDQLAAAIRAALAAHFSGDTARATRARQGVAARYGAAHALPQHVALARAAAAAR
jgi:glycosyltransferase involved in cell wall biosynthesis